MPIPRLPSRKRPAPSPPAAGAVGGRVAPPPTPTPAPNRRRFTPRPGPPPTDRTGPASRLQLRPPAVVSSRWAGMDDAALSAVMEAAFAPTTLSGYGTGLGHFLAHCDTRGVPDEDRCPADEDLLCRFVAAQAGSYSGEYIGKMVSAVGAWHKLYGATWTFRPNSRLSLALRGALSMTPPSSRRPPRDPYTPAYLRAIFPHLDLTLGADAAVWACALCAFWGLMRVEEVTLPTQKSFDPKFHISRQGWSISPPAAAVPGGLVAGALRLPWTKTTRTAGALVVLAGRADDLCPVLALERHLTASLLPPSAPLFAYRHSGRTVPLSRSVFLARLRRAATAAGLPALHGHSFRIGGCTELLLRGAAIIDVKAHGRWKSDAWTTYVREHVQVFSSRLALVPAVNAALLA